MRTLGRIVGEGHLVKEDDAVVAGTLLQTGPEHEALHLAGHHELH